MPCLQAAIITAASADAYAAREALAHPALRPAMTTGQEQALAALVEASGLGRGAMPPGLLDDLMASVALAENQLRALLDRLRSSGGVPIGTRARPRQAQGAGGWHTSTRGPGEQHTQRGPRGEVLD